LTVHARTTQTDYETLLALHHASRFGDVLLNMAKVFFETHGAGALGATAGGDPRLLRLTMAGSFDAHGERRCRPGFEVNQPERRPKKTRPTELPPLVKRKDVIGWVFANNHFAFPSATLLMNRSRHTIPVDLDQELPQFEIIAQSFVQQAAGLQDFGIIHFASTSETARPFDGRP
jgi:hypothetical protein